MPCDLPCGIKKTTIIKTNLIDIENRLSVARVGGVGVDEIGEGDQKVQACSYKITNSWVCDI